MANERHGRALSWGKRAESLPSVVGEVGPSCPFPQKETPQRVGMGWTSGHRFGWGKAWEGQMSTCFAKKSLRAAKGKTNSNVTKGNWWGKGKQENNPSSMFPDCAKREKRSRIGLKGKNSNTRREGSPLSPNTQGGGGIVEPFLTRNQQSVGGGNLGGEPTVQNQPLREEWNGHDAIAGT